ncbi:MAG TPA: hypothetical protein VIK20_07900 [Bacteroidales bacterium]
MILIFVAGCNSAAKKPVDLSKPSVTLTALDISIPLIDEKTPGMESVKYGNEGGEVIKDSKGVYHWFTSEQFGEPYWVANAITHWTSTDGLKWVKDTSWKKEGNHDYTNSKNKSSYFDPTAIYDTETGYWYMFYIAYRCVPDSIYIRELHKANPLGLYAGGWNRAQIYRAKAIKPGLEGLGGPYHDNDADDVVVIEPVDNPQPYELQWVGDTKFGYGCATVTPYKVGNEWYILYAENMLAKSNSLTGKFERLPEGDDSPVTYQRPLMRWNKENSHVFYLENPIIYKIPEGNTGAGTYIMVVGMYIDHSIGVKDTRYGYATSQDGIHWSAVQPIEAKFGDCITSCSFIPEGKDTYSIFVTGRENNYERFTKIMVKLSV